MKNRNIWLIVLLALIGVAIYVMTQAEYINSIIVKKIANAIAVAEGFYKVGSRPSRNHNPGDLKLDLTGKAVRFDGSFPVYANDLDGFEALEKQVRLMFKGSRIYSSSMTIAEVAAKYTATEVDSWANNVANSLGVSTNTKLSELTA